MEEHNLEMGLGGRWELCSIPATSSDLAGVVVVEDTLSTQSKTGLGQKLHEIHGKSSIGSDSAGTYHVRLLQQSEDNPRDNLRECICCNTGVVWTGDGLVNPNK